MAQPDKLVEYFKQLSTVRQRTSYLLKYPDYLQSFDLDVSKVQQVVDLVVSLIERDYASLADIPPHSRWRHFEALPLNNQSEHGLLVTKQTAKSRIHQLVEEWKQKGVDLKEIVVRLLDLFVVSVLLDAGAGDKWTFTVGQEVYNRSEGLGIASLHWFLSGGFSSQPDAPYQCDSVGLKNVTQEQLKKALQVSEGNPLVGTEGRCSLLQRLGTVCESCPQYFQKDGLSRPGNLLYFLLSHPTTTSQSNGYKVHIKALWEVVMEGFSGVWPATRTQLNGVSLGDVWPCQAFYLIYKNEIVGSHSDDVLPVPGGESLIAFHKLSQWLTYSLMEPLALCGISFEGVDQMTGLAEYRNGGVFVDLGVLTLKPAIQEKFKDSLPTFQVYDDTVVEWRALTVALLDRVADKVRQRLKLSSEQLPLAKVLEAGTWKAGRETAAKLRPQTKGPPIQIVSDGTVF